MTSDFPEIKVMYVKSEKGVRGAVAAFDALEAKLMTLKGRKFYGVAWSSGEYWACVALIPDDQPQGLGLEVGTIPGGKYAQKRIHNWEKHASRIGQGFQELVKGNDVDDVRPSIEFYHGMNYIVARVPVK